MKALGSPVKKRQVREMIAKIDKDDDAQVIRSENAMVDGRS